VDLKLYAPVFPSHWEGIRSFSKLFKNKV